MKVRYLLQSALLSAVALFGCHHKSAESQDHDPLYLAYEAPGDHSLGTVTVCTFAGPYQSVVLATLETPLQPYEGPRCDSPYHHPSHSTANISIQRQAVGPTVPNTVEIVWIESYYPSGGGSLPVGSEMLITMRESGGTWFLDGWIPLTTSATAAVEPEPFHDAVELPTEWTALVSELESATTNHTDECPDHNLIRRDDDEYFTYKHTIPESKGCASSNSDVGTAEH